MVNEDIMLEYIKQEPDYLKELIKNKEAVSKDFVDFFLRHNIKRVYLCASGTPHYASVIIQYFLMKMLRIDATSSFPMMFNNHEDFNVNGVYGKDEIALLCPAHSGRTKGPLLAARRAKQLGIPVICTTLNEDGILAKECTVIIKKISGYEESYPESKGHFVTIATLLICIIEAARALRYISRQEYDSYYADFAKMDYSCREAYENTIAWYNANKDLLIHSDCFRFIGYGPNYPTAQEAALKWMESTLKVCIPFELEEYMHGPDLAVRDTVMFYISAEKGIEKERMGRLIRWAKRYTKYNILITNPDNELVDELSLTADFVNREFLSTLEYLIPFQVMAHLLARDLGLSTINPPVEDNWKELDSKFEIEHT
ncbi:MAG: hypothetical protein LIP16_20020 [Clostridium sp.]|nr:hypothetical protein [Clostridium sp.]